jgi:O-antigen/teichoic acid export membrane protein
MAGKFFGYLFTILITRNLGASVWGSFAVAFTVLRLVGLIGNLGTDKSIVRFISQFNTNQNWLAIKDIYRKTCFLLLINGLILGNILYFLSPIIATTIFNNPNLVNGFRILSFGVPFFLINSLTAASLRGVKQIKEYTFLRETSIFLITVSLGALFIFLFQKEPDDLFPHHIYVLGIILTSILGVTLWYRKAGFFLPKQTADSVTVKYLVKFSAPMLLSTSFLFIMGWIDTLMLGAMDTEANVGIYNVSVRISQIIAFPLTAVNSIIAPKISEFFTASQFNSLNKYVRNATKLVFITNLPLFLIIAIFPSFILSLFGEDFTFGINALYILLFGMLMNTLSGSVGNFLNMTGNQKIFQNILFVAAIINIFFNIILIPKYSIIGAAVANALSLTIWNLSCVIFIWKKYRINAFLINLKKIKNG